MNAKSPIINIVGVILCFFVANSSMAALESLSEGDSRTEELPAKDGTVHAVIRRLNFTWKLARFKNPDVSTMLLVVVPSKKLYWVGAARNGASDETSAEREFLILGDRIVGVSSDRGDVLRFYVSAGRLVTNDTAQEVQSIARHKIDNYEKENWDIEEIPFTMELILGPFPFWGRPDSSGEVAPAITKIEVDSNGFTIELAGGKGHGIKGSVSFDNNFQAVKATLKGKIVFPKATP